VLRLYVCCWRRPGCDVGIRRAARQVCCQAILGTYTAAAVSQSLACCCCCWRQAVLSGPWHKWRPRVLPHHADHIFCHTTEFAVAAALLLVMTGFAVRPAHAGWQGCRDNIRPTYGVVLLSCRGCCCCCTAAGDDRLCCQTWACLKSRVLPQHSDHLWCTAAEYAWVAAAALHLLAGCAVRPGHA
jgi:hypothetical protein